MKISIELADLERLLTQQKNLTIERLLGSTSAYNTESTDGHSKSIPNIDKQKFAEIGMTAKFPSDLDVLKRYIS